MQKSKTKLFLVALLLLSLMVQMTPPAVFAEDGDAYRYVSFVYKNHTLKTKKVLEGDTVDATGVPLSVTDPGKVFSHWSEDNPDDPESPGECPAFDFTTAIDKDTDLYAVTKNAWIVTFDSVGGSAVLPKYVEDGDVIDSLPAPVRAGYNFNHWSLTVDGSAIPEGYQVTDNLTLYAVWEQGQIRHTRSFTGKKMLRMTIILSRV